VLNLKWAEKESQRGKPYGTVLARNLPPVQELQQKLIDIHRPAVVPLDDLKLINKRMSEGEAPAATPRRR
jgi:RNA polymerase primary sigma factor